MMNRLEAAARQALARLQAHVDTADLDAIAALNEALAEQADRSGCTAGSDEECANRRCATNCPALAQQAAEPATSPTTGMNMAQRILHVGGRNNAAGYVEFGSIQAVEALVRQVLRDLPTQQPLTDEQKAVLRECRNQAMKWTGQAGIPECAAFGEMAQDLDWLCGQLGITGSTAPTRQPLTPREVELIDGMIEVQMHHAAQCDAIANRTMADKQKKWDMERVELLRKLKAAHGITGSKT